MVSQALSMKEVPSAQPLKASKTAFHSSSSSIAAPQRKRKRLDGEEGALNGDSGTCRATEMSSPTEGAAAGDETAAVSMDAESDQVAPDQVTWDIEQPAGLQEVVRWSTDQQAWPLLQSQLQASPSPLSLYACTFNFTVSNTTRPVLGLANRNICLRSLCVVLLSRTQSHASPAYGFCMRRLWALMPPRRYILASHIPLKAWGMSVRATGAQKLPSCPMGMRMPITFPHPMETNPSR